jgi:two-component system sensor histidine kinase BaeS
MVAALMTAVPTADPLAALNQADTPVALLDRDGTVRGDRWARAALGSERRSALASGRRLTYTVEFTGRTLLVEARPLPGGRGIVLVRSTANAGLLARTMLSRQAVALVVGTAVAGVVGVLLARRLSRPLILAAAAAKAMAGGEREARVPPSGPVEVAEVAVSLNTLAAGLADSERRQREFLLSVSHELKTPLTAVKGFAEALADGVGDSRAAGRIVLDESVRMERLIADLLDLARLEADDFRLDITRIDLTAVLRDADQVWAARCAATGWDGVPSCPPDRSTFTPTRVASGRSWTGLPRTRSG